MQSIKPVFIFWWMSIWAWANQPGVGWLVLPSPVHPGCHRPTFPQKTTRLLFYSGSRALIFIGALRPRVSYTIPQNRVLGSSFISIVTPQFSDLPRKRSLGGVVILGGSVCESDCVRRKYIIKGLHPTTNNTSRHVSIRQNPHVVQCGLFMDWYKGSDPKWTAQPKVFVAALRTNLNFIWCVRRTAVTAIFCFK